MGPYPLVIGEESRRPFGGAHSRGASDALTLLVIVMILGAFLIGLVFGSAGRGQSSPFPVFDLAMKTFVFVYAAFGMVAVLLLRGLGGPLSARLLWLAFAANLAAGVVLLTGYSPWLKAFISSQGPGLWFGDTALDAAVIMMRRVPLFYVPAGALYGLSTYLTWTKIPHPPRTRIGEAAPRAEET